MLVFTNALDAIAAQGMVMTAGRKPKYDPVETPKKAKAYVKDWAKLDADYGAVIPTIEGLSLHLDVHRDTVRAWSNDEDKEEFSGIVKKMYAIQGALLVNKSLTGDYREKTSNALLSRHHDYGERQHVDVTSSDESMKYTQIKLIGVRADEYADED